LEVSNRLETKVERVFLVVINGSSDTEPGLFEEKPPLNVSTSSPSPTPTAGWGTTEDENINSRYYTGYHRS